MKVYVVEKGYEYEGSNVMEIFSSYDKAMEFLKREIDEKEWEKGKRFYSDAGNFSINLSYGEYWTLMEWDVNEN